VSTQEPEIKIEITDEAPLDENEPEQEKYEAHSSDSEGTIAKGHATDYINSLKSSFLKDKK
jgi:hypothetical protein